MAEDPNTPEQERAPPHEQSYSYGYAYASPPDHWPESMFKRYLSILRRHMWPALSVIVIVVTLGILRAYRATPIYQAAARILVERQGPRVMKFEDVMQPSVEWWGQEYYKTQEELAKSRAVMELALDQPEIKELFKASALPVKKPPFWRSMGGTIAAVLGIPPSTPPEPWERLRGAVNAKHANDSHFILVSSEGADPAIAARIANAVARAFVRYHMLRRIEISNDVFLFLQEQKEKEEVSLREAEYKLQKFREKSKISTLSESEQDNPVLKRLAILNGQLTERQLERIDIESQYRVVKEALGRKDASLSAVDTQLFSIPAVKEDRAIEEIRAGLVLAEQEKAALSDVYGPEHPRMQAVQAKLDSLQGKVHEALGNVLGALSNRLKMLQASEEELNKQLGEQNKLALSVAQDALTFGHLSGEVDRHRKLYEVLVQRMGEVALSSDYTRTNVDLVEEASIPKAPIKPNKQKMAVMSIIFALALGIGLAFFLEHIDDTVRTPEDLEIRVGIPVLGFVPEIIVNKEVDSRTASRALVCALEPNSSAVEAYRNIRTNLFFSLPQEDSRILLITSGGPGDGKTTTACNLAITIAQSGKKVLLVDADFRRPRIHKVFGLDLAVGLSGVLSGQITLDQAVQKSVHDVELIEKLDIVTAGATPPNPTELFEASTLPKLIEEMRGKYDRVIIDTPPVLFVSDTSILSTVCDGAIVVVKSDKRTRAFASRACKQLTKVKGRIIGGILNYVQVTRFGYYYSEYYYHGYARYRSDYYSSYYSQDRKDKKAAGKSIKV